MKIEKITPQIAALYLGAKCDLEWEAPYNDGVWNAIEIDHSVIEKLSVAHISITPHLRRLESVTEEEAREVYKISRGVKWKELDWHTAKAWFLISEYERLVSPIDMIIGDSYALLYLLSKHFDLFGLIENSLAKEINPETVTQ